MLLRAIEKTIPIVSVIVLHKFALELFLFVPNLDFKLK